MLFASLVSYVVLLIEANYSYINKLSKSTAFSTHGFYLIGKDLLKMLYYLYEKINDWFKRSISKFLTEKFSRIPDVRRSIKNFYEKNMQLFEYKQRDMK